MQAAVLPSYSLEYSLPVTLVKQYAYCPMIPWIMVKMGVSEEATPSMIEGASRCNASFKERVASMLRLPKPWRIEKPLYSRRLKLRGVVDIIAGERLLKVVEVKAFKRRVKWSKHFKQQLMLYALLVNDVMGPVDEAILVLGDSVYRYEVTLDDLREAEKLVAKTRMTIDSEEPPTPSVTEGMCRYCWFKRFCLHHW